MEKVCNSSKDGKDSDGYFCYREDWYGTVKFPKEQAEQDGVTFSNSLRISHPVNPLFLSCVTPLSSDEHITCTNAAANTLLQYITFVSSSHTPHSTSISHS